MDPARTSERPMCPRPPAAVQSRPMRDGQSGQAAIETALVLPLTLFLVLGSLQLFLLQQGRIAAQYAAFQSARTGSLSHGACKPMTHAALLTLLPNVHSFLGDPNLSGTPSQRLGQAFTRIKDNHYGGYRWGTWTSPGAMDESIVWVMREGRAPTVADVTGFDQPLSGGEPFRLEVRLIYWAPLRIPMADWMYARIAAARMGILPYTKFDPLVVTRKTTDWSGGTFTLENQLAAEFRKRLVAGHYVFPIAVTSTMRMMTPPRLSEFVQQNCPSPGFN